MDAAAASSALDMASPNPRSDAASSETIARYDSRAPTSAYVSLPSWSALPPTGQMLSLDAEPHTDKDNDECSFYDKLCSAYTKTPEQIYIEKETWEEIHHALGMISPRERTYLRYRYGFDDDVLHDRKETAMHFHLSGNRAKSIEQDALNNIRKELHW